MAEIHAFKADGTPSPGAKTALDAVGDTGPAGGTLARRTALGGLAAAYFTLPSDYSPSAADEVVPRAYVDESAEHVPHWVGETFSVLGDSIVSTGAPMWDAVRDRLGFSDYRNGGVWGAPMADGTAKGAGTVTTVRSLDYARDAMVYIAAGTNDLTQNVPLGALGTVAQVTFDRNTFYGAYRSTIEYVLASNPHVRLFLATPIQRDAHGYSVETKNGNGLALGDYREAILTLGEFYGVPVVDMYATAGITARTLPTFTEDGLHPNADGFARMADVACGQLRSHG